MEGLRPKVVFAHPEKLPKVLPQAPTAVSGHLDHPNPPNKKPADIMNLRSVLLLPAGLEHATWTARQFLLLVLGCFLKCCLFDPRCL